MRGTKLLWTIGLLSLVVACKNNGKPALPSATGSIYECLIVMNDTLWDAEVGEEVRNCLGADMPCLPQKEPYFSLTQVSFTQFDNFLKPVRNILMIDIDPAKYTQGKIVYTQDYYAHPQALARITAPTKAIFDSIIEKNSTKLCTYFVRQEIERHILFLRAYTNKEARKVLQERTGCDLMIPEDFQVVKTTDDFLWFANDNGSIRQDIVVYTYPYTDENTFTLHYLTAKRDSILREHVEGSIDGSYVGTEYNIFPPQFNVVSVQNNQYCAEVRGLWKMKEGTAMGGPFVSHTRLNEVKQQCITAECFIFAAGQKKRNALRKAEAILYTLTLPTDSL